LRIEEDTVKLLAWRLESIPWTTTVEAEWIEAAWSRPGYPGAKVTGEPGGHDSLGDPKLGEERLDARWQRPPGTVAGECLPLVSQNAKTVAHTKAHWPTQPGRL
jgi:hypothetical protein